jgi:hypothetical protein
MMMSSIRYRIQTFCIIIKRSKDRKYLSKPIYSIIQYLTGNLWVLSVVFNVSKSRSSLNVFIEELEWQLHLAFRVNFEN